jgi:rod shape-determining protein MreD
MNKNIYIYPLLVLVFLIQLFLTRYFTWTPDVVLIIVVFVGIFYKPHEAVLIGLLAGILRGSVSVGTLPVDIAAFPVAAIVAGGMARALNKHSWLTHALVTLVCMMLVIVFQISYINFVAGNNVSMKFILSKNWNIIIITALISPIIFSILGEVWSIRD